MQAEKKIFPKLYPLSRDLSKTWFISYQTFDYNSAQPVKHKYKGQLNLITNLEDRLNLAEKYIEDMHNGIELPNHAGQRKIYKMPVGSQPHYSIKAILSTSLEMVQNEISEKTYSDYRGKLNTFIHFLTNRSLISLPIGQITSTEANSFLLYLRTVKNFQNKTLNAYKTLLKKIWSIAIKKYKLNQNPFEDIKKLKNRSKPFESYSVELEQYIAKTLPNYDKQVYLAAQCIYYCCVRVDEARLLKVGNVDLVNQILTIPGKISKTGEERKIIIPDPLCELFIKNNITIYDQDDYLFSENKEPGKLKLSYNSLRRRYAIYRVKFNIPDQYKLYGLKHTSNKKMALKGFNAVDPLS
jgi:integrase